MKLATRLANITLLGAIVTLVMLLFYEIFDYQDRLTGFTQFIGYYLLPFIVLVLLTLSFRLDDLIKVRMVGALVVITLLLYGVEGLLTFRPDTSGVPPPLDIRTKLSDKLEEAGRLKQEGIEAWPTIHPQMLLYAHYKIEIQGRMVFPLGGISGVLSVFCAETEDYTIFQSDEYGFHNPKGLYQVESLDIAVVGDSFAQGACVPAERNAVSLMRDSYPNMLNFGSGGNGPLLELATLKEFAAPLRPKIVLWFYFENDMKNLEQEKEEKLLLKYLEGNYHQNLASIQPEIDQSLKEFIENSREETEGSRTGEGFLRFLLLTHLRGQLGLHLDPDNDEDDQPDLATFEQILASAKEATGSWGGQLYFVYLPAWERFGNPGQAESHRDQILAIANSLEIPIIDIYQIFVTYPDPMAFFPLRRSGHYNEAGYRVVAETVLKALQETPSNTPSALSGARNDQD